MTASITNHIEALRDLNLQLRRQLEQAEACVPELNRVVEQLRSFGLLDDAMLLGNVIHQGNYDVCSKQHDSGWVIQAAFSIAPGGGLGTVTWDMDAYATFIRHGYIPPTSAAANFRRLEESPPAIKALMLPQAALFLQRIGRLAGAELE